MGIAFNEKIEGWRKWLGIIWVVMCSFGWPIISHYAYGAFSENFNSFMSNTFNFINFIVIPTIYSSVIVKPLKHQSIKKIIKWSLVGTIIAFASNMLFHSLIQPYLMNLFGIEKVVNANNNSLKDGIKGGSVIFWIVVSTIIAPLTEEISYRVCLFTTLRKRSRIFAHLVTALVFGFAHIFSTMAFGNYPQEIISICSYMAFSLILTIMYEKLKTPVPGIIAHMLCNFIFIIFVLV